MGSNVSGELLYRPNRVTFRINSLAATADFNDDGLVDGGDLAVWKAAFIGKIDRENQLAADATGDGLVDGSDFLAWQRQFSGERGGTPGRTLGIGAVPEPASILLAAMALLGMPRRKTRAQSFVR